MNYEKTDWKMAMRGIGVESLVILVAVMVAWATITAWGNPWLGVGMGFLAFGGINRLFRPYRMAIVGKNIRDTRFNLDTGWRSRQSAGYIPPLCKCSDSKSVYDEACGCSDEVIGHKHCCNCGGAIYLA